MLILEAERSPEAKSCMALLFAMDRSVCIVDLPRGEDAKASKGSSRLSRIKTSQWLFGANKPQLQGLRRKRTAKGACVCRVSRLLIGKVDICRPALLSRGAAVNSASSWYSTS